jgi:DnaK suppressor protein
MARTAGKKMGKPAPKSAGTKLKAGKVLSRGASSKKQSAKTVGAPRPQKLLKKKSRAKMESKGQDDRHKGKKDRERTVETVPVRPPQPVREMVTTDSKPKKNQAGLSVKDLEHFREMLLAKRRELVGDMSSMEREALRSTTGSNLSNLPVHMADMGTDNYEQEFTLGLVEKDRTLLREINLALAKIQDGTYGICEGTGKPISKARLEAKPWAKYSIEYARLLESGQVRRQ